MLTNQYTDQEIVTAILNGDKDMVSYFLDIKCHKMLIYIIRSVFDGRIEEEELKHELFLYLGKDDWHKLRTFDYRSKLTTWLSTVATRFFVKKRNKLIESESTEAQINKNECFDESSKIENIMDVREAVSLMPNERYKPVITFLYFRDLKFEEAAKELNTSIDNLYNLHRRALNQLKLILSRDEYYGYK